MKNKDLMMLPIINLVITAIVLAVIIGVGVSLEIAMYDSTKEFNIVGAVVLFLIGYFIISFVTVYLLTVLLACVMQRLKSQPSTLKVGFKIANSRLKQILGWTLINVTLGVIINFLENLHSIIADIVALVIGGGWAIGMYMGLPLMIEEGLGPIESFKRGMKMFGKGWRKIASANFVFLLIFFAVILVLHVAAMFMPFLELPWITGAVFTVFFLLMITFGTAMNTVVRCAVFLTLHHKQEIPGFNKDDLKAGFRQRRKWLR